MKSAPEDFENKVRQALAERTRFSCEKQFEVGKSGNRWKVDCVLLDKHDVRKGYVEVKETSRSSNKSTYINHMRRAYAEMGDFRQLDAPKAVVVAEKWDFGRIDWDAMFNSIDCSLVDLEEIDEFVSKLQT